MLHPNTSQELSLNFYKDKKKAEQQQNVTISGAGDHKHLTWDLKYAASKYRQVPVLSLNLFKKTE